jgi:hypothetical protein
LRDGDAPVTLERTSNPGGTVHTGLFAMPSKVFLDG